MPQEKFVDVYRVLGVPPTATQADLARAHRRLVRRHHPDLAPRARREAATRQVQDLNVAYGLVRDPASRAAYDRLRQLHRARYAASAAVSRAGGAGAGAGAALTDQWDAAVRAAGRWAGAWWRRNRVPLRRAAIRARMGARRAGLDVAGRVRWLVTSVGWALAGLAVAVAVQRTLGITGTLTPLAGVGAGALAGSQRGWHRRLRLAGLPVRAVTARIGLAAACGTLLAALVADAFLGW